MMYHVVMCKSMFLRLLIRPFTLDIRFSTLLTISLIFTVGSFVGDEEPADTNDSLVIISFGFES